MMEDKDGRTDGRADGQTDGYTHSSFLAPRTPRQVWEEKLLMKDEPEEFKSFRGALANLSIHALDCAVFSICSPILPIPLISHNDVDSPLASFAHCTYYVHPFHPATQLSAASIANSYNSYSPFAHHSYHVHPATRLSTVSIRNGLSQFSLTAGTA